MVLDYSCPGSVAVRSRRMRSAVNYFVGIEATCRITSIDNELRFFDDALVVVVGMVGGNEHAIVLLEFSQGHAFHLQVILAPTTHKWEIGVVVADLGARLAQ